MNRTISCTINGTERTLEVEPSEKLSSLMRRLGLKSVKVGCNEGCCGTCTVLVDGRTVYSCLAYAASVDGRNVRTVEHLGSIDRPNPIQQALADEGAVQCGFCIPAMVLSAEELLEKNPRPTADEMRKHLDGNLCRCTGYEKIESALMKLAGKEEDV